jgi:hypothetical protein
VPEPRRTDNASNVPPAPPEQQLRQSIALLTGQH